MRLTDEEMIAIDQALIDDPEWNRLIDNEASCHDEGGYKPSFFYAHRKYLDAQLAKQQSPEETGWCPQHGYPLPCYKCGYSKPPEDLREAIARIICCFSKENKTCSECKENTPKTPFPDCFEDIRNHTDQILSLIQPLISQARADTIREISGGIRIL